MTDPAPRGVAAPRPELRSSGIPPTSLGTLAIGVVVVAALYFGHDVFVPVALAILLSFALGPPVLLLRHWGFGRVPSVGAVAFLAFLVILGIGAFVGFELAELAADLPEYQTNIEQKVATLRSTTAQGGFFARLSAMLNNLDNEIANPASNAAPAKSRARAETQRPPVLVEIAPTGATRLQLVYELASPLLKPLAMAGIVIVFVIFFLVQREDLRDRFIRLAGAGDLHRTTGALDDAAARLSRYLLTQTAINTSFGILVGAGLWFIGVPNPALWGILGLLLRFVPYIGPVIAAALPIVVAFAVGPGWSMLLWTFALFVCVEIAIGQVVEPLLYGHSTGLSGIAVVVAAAFWTLLWGPVGLLLSTPLTMCLVVVGRHVEHLQFLEILLGDQPALMPAEGFYQRMLADDPDEASRQAEEYLKERPLSAYYDDIVIGGLALAQRDVNRGALYHEQRVGIRTAIDAVMDNLSDHDDAPAEIAGLVLAPEELAPAWGDSAVLCIAGRGSLDEASAALLAQLLQKHGIGARVVTAAAVSPPHLFALDTAGVQMAYVCYLEPGNFANPRYLVRRLRRKLPDAAIAAGFWTLDAEEAERRNVPNETGVTLVATSLRQAVGQAVAAARRAANPAATPAATAPPSVSVAS